MPVTLNLFRHYDAQIPKGHVWIIGNFDGLHKGHDILIQRAKDIAKSQGKKIGLLSFNPHPRQFFSSDHAVINIMQPFEKIKRLSEMQIDFYFMHPFNAQLANLSPEGFCQKIKRQLNPSHIIIGHDFHFGKQRAGTPDILYQFCQDNAIGCHVIKPQMNADGLRYSSEAIRKFLSEGDIKSVKSFMNHPYIISGRVRHGKKLARQLGFPTANIIPRNLYLPKFGVYGCYIANMQDIPAIANIGVKPTLNDEHKPILEVHIPEFKGDLYGQKLTVVFDRFIRPEQKFPNLEALKEQIAQDIDSLPKILTV